MRTDFSPQSSGAIRCIFMTLPEIEFWVLHPFTGHYIINKILCNIIFGLEMGERESLDGDETK